MPLTGSNGATVPVPLVDTDVTEDSFEGDAPVPLPAGIQLDKGLQDDYDARQRAEYLSEEVDNVKATKWVYDTTFCKEVDINGASKQVLSTLKTVVAPTLQRCANICNKESVDNLMVKDFLNIELNNNLS